MRKCSVGKRSGEPELLVQRWELGPQLLTAKLNSAAMGLLCLVNFWSFSRINYFSYPATVE